MEGNDNSYTQIFIAKIHPRVSEKDLKYKFKKYGEIVDVRLKKGYAFIDFENSKEAEQAVQRMNGKDLEGQPIVVQPSIRSAKRERGREDRETDDRIGRRGPIPEDKCFNCDKTGHWANECREPKRDRISRRDRNDFKCFKCGDTGHKQRFCPKSDRRRSSSRDRRYRRRRSPSRSRSSSSNSSRSDSRSRSRSRSHSHRKRNNHRNRSVSRSESSHSRRNYRRKNSENGKSLNK